MIVIFKVNIKQKARKDFFIGNLEILYDQTRNIL